MDKGVPGNPRSGPGLALARCKFQGTIPRMFQETKRGCFQKQMFLVSGNLQSCQGCVEGCVLCASTLNLPNASELSKQDARFVLTCRLKRFRLNSRESTTNSKGRSGATAITKNGYALFVDERASAARCRFSIMATYLTSRSIDMALRHALKAATPVVPPPAKLSSTMSPSLEKISTSLRVSSSGFSVGCSVRL